MLRATEYDDLNARFVQDWRSKLLALHPDTAVRWHKASFSRYWTWESRRTGRPAIDPELHKLIREMQAQNLTWGAPRIHGELLKSGYEISEATVCKYMNAAESHRVVGGLHHRYTRMAA